jgi:hypothetical protein
VEEKVRWGTYEILGRTLLDTGRLAGQELLEIDYRQLCNEYQMWHCSGRIWNGGLGPAIFTARQNLRLRLHILQ